VLVWNTGSKAHWRLAPHLSGADTYFLAHGSSSAHSRMMFGWSRCIAYAGSVTTSSSGNRQGRVSSISRLFFRGRNWVAGLRQGAGSRWADRWDGHGCRIGLLSRTSWRGLPRSWHRLSPAGGRRLCTSPSRWSPRTTAVDHPAAPARPAGGGNCVLEAAPGPPALFARLAQRDLTLRQRSGERVGTGRCSCSPVSPVPLSQMQLVPAIW